MVLKYGITEVCYNANNVIEKVKCGLIGFFNTIAVSEEQTKSIVIKNIEDGNIQYFTWVDNEKGAEVEVVTEGSNKYIRTKGNTEKKDNLGELAKY